LIEVFVAGYGRMGRFFSPKGFREYMGPAKGILEGNWTGSYTRPSPGLYPHQWNWDSGFIAIGYAHYNQKRAQQEMLSLYSHQWSNGMVPQIVFNPGALGHYFPEPDFWQVPEGRPTSGITMPPLGAIACAHIYAAAGDRKEAHRFIREMFPKLKASHQYLYRFRDPDNTGLVYIRHPWESGLDNSPAWDEPLRAIAVDRSHLPRYERKDLDHGVPVEQRPSDDEYDRYVYLVDLFRKHLYREEEIYRNCPFLIQDVLFNSILCRANRDLLEMGKVLNEDVAEIQEWVDHTSKAISERLWCSPCEKFESYDLVGGGHLHTATAAGFMPLFAGGASKDQAEIMYRAIDSIAFCSLNQGNCFTIPNYDMTSDDFDSKNYWRGPVWSNINWMLSQGLTYYGYREKADAMKRDLIQLPIRFGFHEYYDSKTGKGYGSSNFSWTAALFLDLIYEYYDKDKHGFDWLHLGRTRRLKKREILNPEGPSSSSPTHNIASHLMAAMGDLKAQFFDVGRGRVDYQRMQGSHAYGRYQEIVSGLRDFDHMTLKEEDEKKAFWINLYNAVVVQGIIELGITASVREYSAFFQHIAYQIGAFTLTADEMEHGILRANARPPYRFFRPFKRNDSRKGLCLEDLDPRIHFALVCGSRSCAPIDFYEADSVEGQLDRAAAHFINSSEIIILPEQNKVFLSQIFNWYERDFGGKAQILNFLLKYLRSNEKFHFLEKNIDNIRVEYLFYDWNLNH